jgi:hypothetical protein
MFVSSNEKKDMSEGTTVKLQSNFSAFLLGAVLNLLVVVNMEGIVDYSLKAIAGGLIWVIFKVTGEYLTAKVVQRKKEREEK